MKISLSNTNGVKCVYIADIHFAHPGSNVGKLYVNIQQYLYPELTDCQILFICGDIFHSILQLPYGATNFVVQFFIDILKLAKTYGFKIRVIDGTFLHDRNQPRMLLTLNKEIDVDCKVISDVQIEHITDWNNKSKEELKIVYIPDSLPYKNSKQIINKIKELYTCIGWTKANLVIGHGTFSHTLPRNIKLPNVTFEIDQFKNLISGYIVMGHIHTPSRKQNVIYVGSFDRIAHGEEEHKGFLVSYKNKEDWTFKFIENKNASLYLTLKLSGKNTDEIISDFINKIEKKFPNKEGNVRILYSDPEIKAILSNICNTKYPKIKFSAKNILKEENSLKLEDFKLVETESEILNLENICGLIANTLAQDEEFGKYQLTKNTIMEAVQQLGV